MLPLAADFIVATFFAGLGEAMRLTWDAEKNKANKAKHGIGFEAVERFEWDQALFEFDDREDYGELREIAIGFIGVALYVLVFAEADDETVRLISLRPASSKEASRFARQR
ncbi:MAG: BrnT family toxin [Hyphomicrobiaceae bacterium]|nr:BrnT family toxin [Hyphomicrobiaceae bacterium]